MITGIIIAAAVVGILGILIGVFLGVASEKFKVEVDEKEILVRNELPGNNCGGCGYAGCDALAKAIAAGEARWRLSGGRSTRSGQNRRHHGRGRRKRSEESGFCKM